MLQYLINATATWLISLVLFDLFLRRESYHNYNRFYLLFTFLLGALFPLVQWQGSGRLPIVATEALDGVSRVKRTIIDASTPSSAIGWQQWLLMAYLAGVLVAVTLLVIEIVKLIALYRSAKKYQSDGWTILETGKEHAPFSFMNLLFICTREQYTNDEWDMILVHERRHKTLRHFLDLLLMQSARVILWFHPLVYIYNKRLLLVHEYQADKVTALQPRVYGQFLIEQAMLLSAPSISHSFNRSPIKKRIVMLTRSSSFLAKSKMLVFIPLALVIIICCSRNSFSRGFEKNGNFITYKGNTFESKNPTTDTFMLLDPVTGKEEMKVVKTEPAPFKMNGQPIYGAGDVSIKPEFKVKDITFADFIMKKILPKLNALPDGTYHLFLFNVIVGSDGQIVFYDYNGISRVQFSHKGNDPVPDALKKDINDAVVQFMSSDERWFVPGKKNGQNVVVLDESYEISHEIEVKDHQAKFK
jgi:BlaR1 peptidase M56